MISENDISNSRERIANNASEFSNQLTGMLAELSGGIEQAFRKAILDLYTRIIERTPIDTGRARANWSVGLKPQNSSKLSTDWESEQNKEKKDFETEWGRFKTTTGFNFTLRNGKVYIYNNLEYIEPLESGHSQGQAPEGMVAISLAEFNEYFRQAIRTTRGIS